MHNDFYALIMAGGGGTRLWPVSRRSRPKQMIRFFDGETMFQTSVRRLDGLFTPERIFVVTVSEQAEQLQAQCPEIPRENFILEPSPRGTASAIGLGAIHLCNKNPQAIVAVLTADHFIKDEVRFRNLLETSYSVAQETYLVTLGITPTFPSTAYGYIQIGLPLGSRDGVDVFSVDGFREKPDQSTAEKLLLSGDYAWNSGMFILQGDTFLNEAARQMPDLYQGLKEIESSLGSQDELVTTSRVWERLTPQTIDYGIMEGAEKVAIIPGKGLGWNDVGSWESLFESLPTDENGNIFVNSDSLSLETTNTLLFDDAQKRLVVTVGLDDLVIVETKDVLLICKKEDSQKVRNVVEELKRSGRGEII
jgi:mannose-1-phosphate guanylyltransferase